LVDDSPTDHPAENVALSARVDVLGIGGGGFHGPGLRLEADVEGAHLRWGGIFPLIRDYAWSWEEVVRIDVFALPFGSPRGVRIVLRDRPPKKRRNGVLYPWLRLFRRCTIVMPPRYVETILNLAPQTIPRTRKRRLIWSRPDFDW
jgi:hypothetical protein